MAKGLSDVLENNKVNGPYMKGGRRPHAGCPDAVSIIGLLHSSEDGFSAEARSIAAWLPIFASGFCSSSSNIPAI